MYDEFDESIAPSLVEMSRYDHGPGLGLVLIKNVVITGSLNYRSYPLVHQCSQQQLTSRYLEFSDHNISIWSPICPLQPPQ